MSFANPIPCEIEGCDIPRYARGLCHRHYNMLKRHGTTDRELKDKRTLQEQLDLLPEIIQSPWADIQELYNEFYTSTYEYSRHVLTETDGANKWHYAVPKEFMRGSRCRSEFIVKGVMIKQLLDSGRIEIDEVSRSLRKYVRRYEVIT